MNLAPGPDHWPFTLEKWYIDTLMPDRTVLLVYFGRFRAVGIAVARLTAELYRPDGTVQRGDAGADRLTGGEDWLRCGPLTLAGEKLSWHTRGLSGEVEFSPRFSCASLRDPFLKSGGRELAWTVEIPDAEVRGEVRWPGGSAPIRGRGYRDRVWFDLRPWRFPIKELHWGRAAAGPHAATWVRAQTPTGVVEAAWCDGRVLPQLPAEIELRESRVFLEADVLGLEGLRLGIARPLLRRLTGDPHEVKWVAAARLRGHEGVAVHEVVRWR